jgi:hypothetical protein
MHGPENDCVTADPTFRQRWLLLVVALLPLGALWSLSNPMFASPDETVHMVRAQGLSAGDFTSPFVTDGPPIDSILCFRFQPEVTAACQDLTWGESGTEIDAGMDRYPPLFHVVAAVPAIFSSGLAGAYLMRIWVMTLSVVLVAFAGSILTRPDTGRWPLVGLFVAITPMALFTMSTVNPSGLAVAVAATYVAGCLALRTDRRRNLEVRVAVVLGALGLLLIRRDGIIWLATISLVLLPLVPVRRVTTQASSGRVPRVVVAALAAVATIGLVVALWVGDVAGEFLRTWRDGDGGGVWESARLVRTYLYQIVGTFGWLDSPIGDEAFLLAIVAAGGLLILGIAGTQRRLAASTVLAVAALIVTPVVFGVIRPSYLQGRYLLPIWVAMTIVAAASVAGSAADEITRRAARVVLGAWLVIHMVAFAQNLRRYSVGRSGSWDFLLDGGEWAPPLTSNFVAVALYAVALAVAAVACGRVLAISDDRTGDVADPDRTTEERADETGQAGTSRLGPEARVTESVRP